MESYRRARYLRSAALGGHALYPRDRESRSCGSRHSGCAAQFGWAVGPWVCGSATTKSTCGFLYHSCFQACALPSEHCAGSRRVAPLSAGGLTVAGIVDLLDSETILLI